MNLAEKIKLLVWGVAAIGLFPAIGYTATFTLPPPGQDLIGSVKYIQARYEDTLSDIARSHDLGYREIVAANPEVDPWLPGAGTTVIVPSSFILPPGPRKGIVINLAELRLYYYPPGGEQVITHPLGIGREGWSTPTGTMEVVAKKRNPSWRVPKSIREEHAAKNDPLPELVPPGPDNPLGRFALRLSNTRYLLHGTNQPWGVGMRVSHGCIRLYPEDIQTLFPMVPVGTSVRIINQPYKAGWLDGTLFVEAHAPLSEQIEEKGNDLTPLTMAIIGVYGDSKPSTTDWQQAQEIAKRHSGVPIPISQSLARSSGTLKQNPDADSAAFGY
ncbi:ErfK/YbiS/YcfS/YnhG family protein [hydrothermal vent metagenome]|uniref:ErfK/YbiS/YcfS/YnhG family protein n=1 Tax=hydrothermal vent metagenome TaxID=652676 RepID=A0A3B1BZ01_9ZZZZ